MVSVCLFVLLLDWVLHTTIQNEEDAFQLCRRISSHHSENRLYFLDMRTTLAFLSYSAAGGQCMFTNLVQAAAKVWLHINTTKMEVLTILKDLDIKISCSNASVAVSTLQPCTQFFFYLGGSISHPPDFQRNHILSGAVSTPSIWTLLVSLTRW